MNRIELSSATYSTNPFSQSSCFYVIESDINLEGNSWTLANDIILSFQGGSLNNGILVIPNLNIVRIEGKGFIFKDDLSFSLGSVLYQHELQAEWFGVMPNNDASITTARINRAITACYNTRVRKLYFNIGTFNINGTIHIGRNTDDCMIGDPYYNYWGLELWGAGTIPSHGTTFYLMDGSQFVVDQRDNYRGERRGGGIYDINFRKHANTELSQSTGLVIKYAHTFTIYKCAFSYLETAIQLEGRSYYVHISSCTFDNCTTGIKSAQGASADGAIDYGYPNNNMIEGCMFANCGNSQGAYSLDLSEGGVAWHIMDTDFEGNNGTIALGDRHRMTNVRIERNLPNVPWLTMGNKCTIDVEFCQTDSVIIDQTWRCIVYGNNNRLKAHFYGATPYALVAYGKGNEYNIVSENRKSTTPMQFVFYPEDVFVLNGYSNLDDYIGTNLISGVRYMDISDEGNSLYLYDSLYNYIYSNQYNPGDYLAVNKQCFRPIKSSNGNNPLLDLISPTHGNLYKSCKFCLNGTATFIPLFEGFAMNYTEANRWYTYVSAFTPSETNSHYSTSISNITLCEPMNVPYIYIRDVVVSQIPLYNRPILSTLEESTLNQLQPDGIIHLYKTYVNHTITTFSWIPNRLQHYSNLLNKTFYYSDDQQKYYEKEGKELILSGRANGMIMTQPNSGSLNFLLWELLNVDVELYDFMGNYLFFQARRTSINNNFNITIVKSIGMSLVDHNAAGTLVIDNYPKTIIPWITLAQ